MNNRDRTGMKQSFTTGEVDQGLVQFLLDLGISLSSELYIDKLLEKIVDEALRITNADGCSLYLVHEDGMLHFTISKNKSLKMNIGGYSGTPVQYAPVPLDPAFVSAYAAIHNKIVNIRDVYKSSEFDFTGPKKYDLLNEYHSESMLVSPLTNHEGEVIGVMQLLNAIDPANGGVIPFDKKFEVLIKSLSSFAAMAITNVRLVDETRERARLLKDANLDAIYSLAMAAEEKDDTTGEHVRRIQMYSTVLSSKLGQSDRYSDEIGYSSIMHDVGKLSIPDSIIKKPAKLSSEEFDIMKTHTTAGERILPSSTFFEIARQIAKCHHEKWDGSGYPDGLVGEDIPLPARIVAVADVFDALTNARPYKESWPVEKALEELKRNSGSHFDPYLIGVWEKLCKQGTPQQIAEKMKQRESLP